MSDAGDLLGFVDRFDPPDTIWGWARNSNNIGSGRDITIRVRRGDRIIAQGPLTFSRPDIIADSDYLLGFRIACDEEIPDEAIAFCSLMVEALDSHGRIARLRIFDQARSYALERLLSASPALGVYSAAIILPRLASSPDLGIEAKARLRDVSDRFFREADQKFLYAFESLGRDCLVGGMQRAFGAEPLGLWRFAGIGIDEVTAALNDGLAGIGAAEFTRIIKDDLGEYYTTDTRYHMSSHTATFEGTVDFDDFYMKQCRKIDFLRRNMLEKLESGEKIFVIHAIPDEIPDTKLRALLQAIRRYGPSPLLYLQLATEAHPIGTVSVRDDGILCGRVQPVRGELMQPEAEVREGWMQVLRRARALVAP